MPFPLTNHSLSNSQDALHPSDFLPPHDPKVTQPPRNSKLSLSLPPSTTNTHTPKLLPMLLQLNLRLHPLQIGIILALLKRMPLMLALVWIPPRIATAFVEIDENVGAGVAPGEGDFGGFDGFRVLVGAGGGGGVVVLGHGDGRFLCGMGEGRGRIRGVAGGERWGTASAEGVAIACNALFEQNDGKFEKKG
ncbi:hypothetical protein ACHAW6_007480 [Cyclotella cf. meneghiniana]